MSIYPKVDCPLFLRRFRRGILISILCDGEQDKHNLISSSIEEREAKINNICNNYQKCKKYQIYEQKI